MDSEARLTVWVLTAAFSAGTANIVTAYILNHFFDMQVSFFSEDLIFMFFYLPMILAGIGAFFYQYKFDRYDREANFKLEALIIVCLNLFSGIMLFVLYNLEKI